VKKDKAPKAAPKGKLKARAKAAERPAPAPAPKSGGASTRGSVAFVCSECYEEFLLPSNYSQEMVSCPDCLHVGKRPDSDFLRTVNLHKAGERKSFLIAIGAGVLLFVLLLATVWFTSGMYLSQHQGKGLDKNVIMALLGGSALLTIVFLWLVVRAEGNRWEVYF